MQNTPSLTVDRLQEKPYYRLDTIDFLRGLVMVIMALDHTREHFHSLAFTQDPLNLQTTTPALFLTRWITHFCAPVFVFLSGTSVYLQSLRKSSAELREFLLKRGLWLILVEITLVTFGLTFNISFSLVILQVIWAIGISMIILGLLIKMPFKMLLIIGLAIVLLHNFLDFYEAAARGPLPAWYSILHQPRILPLSNSFAIGSFYPFLPWTGLMICGYCFGKMYSVADEAARKKTMILGVIVILVFLFFRLLNFYGDPLKWSVQNNFLYTLFSFVNTQKYPPSLLFMCMTIGPALLLLGLIKSVQNKLMTWITVYGRVPFFYFIVHFYVLHTAAAIFFLSRGHSFAEGMKGIANFPFRFIVPGEGVSLLLVYVIWVLLVVLMYPLCKSFGEYKRNHRKWWLSYL